MSSNETENIKKTTSPPYSSVDTLLVSPPSIKASALVLDRVGVVARIARILYLHKNLGAKVDYLPRQDR